ncbi:M23 family metallopeptidase [Novosphingobium sp. 1949]|uniref:M23 family metallopeptidase n=1 Tax=Novosphingobium organovorum TaxID=2930092 RepID=A0ABT0BHH3_9SPHN|nr:M23 family metallopeptidase [Novosphingobium organovorum]MCJ2184513.1 M23 family metallopeptidase [Novosphingobium organovorum]
MVVTRVFANIRAFAGVAIIAGASIAAHPALANSAAASADIAAPLRAAQTATQSATGGEDEQFRTLFSSWQTYEETGLAAARPKAVAGSSDLIAPVSIPSRNPLDHYVMTSSFGMREHPILGRRIGHKGIDLAAPTGTPVYAPADGVVARAAPFSSYGLFIEIEHGGSLETRYGHLSRLNVAEGQTVHKGDLIGFVGTTGRSTGPHLHYEVRVDGVAVNPIPYMQAGFAAKTDASGPQGS